MIRLIEIPEEYGKASTFSMEKLKACSSFPVLRYSDGDRATIAGMEVRLHPGMRVDQELVEMIIGLARQIETDNLEPSDFIINLEYREQAFGHFVRARAVELPRVQYWSPANPREFFAPLRRYERSMVIHP